MKYSKNTYMKALAALAALRTTLPEKEQHTVDFVAEAITEKAGRDTRPAAHADRIPGATDVDKAAHRVLLAAESNEGVRWMPSGVKCKTCGGELDTYYCEERLYMVRCRQCEKVVLLKSSCPKFAAEEAHDGPTI